MLYICIQIYTVILSLYSEIKAQDKKKKQLLKIIKINNETAVQFLTHLLQIGLGKEC